MKKLFPLVALVGSVALVGCNTTAKPATTHTHTAAHTHTHKTVHGQKTAMQHGDMHPSIKGKTMTYLCDNGVEVQATQLSDESIGIKVDNYTATLNIAPSASGSRYVSNRGLFGSGGEWHTKGHEANFAYTGVHGAKGETVCRMQ